MYDQIEKIKRTRSFLIDGIKELEISQLNKIPPGFNNNIIWNLGHLIAAQQGLCYLRSGVAAIVDEKFINEFKSGSKPERLFDLKEFETIKQLLVSTLDQLERDYNAELFLTYTTFTTRYGVELKSIDEAIGFLSFHEGLHSGYINALKRLV